MRSTAVLFAAITAVAILPAAPRVARAQSAPNTMSRTSAGTAATPSGPQQAGGNDNQAVATTAANAAQPAHGANSFTRAQATRRLNRRGFRQVHDLIKDADGVWHGAATRNGAAVQVWEDYKGNVGTE